MFEKLKDTFKSKDKKVENLVFLLIILILTLIFINYIFDDENKKEKNYEDAVLASAADSSVSLESRIENILSQIDGVR